MKYLFCLIIILFLSCNQNKSSPKNVSVQIDEDGIYLVEGSNDSLVVESKEENNDCIFEQSTQTDEFLNGIKEFEGYIWNSETKIATIKLSENETLEIYRGGCVHFGISATFTFNNKKLSFLKDKEFIIRKSLWISKLLTEFHFEKLSNSLKSKSYIIDNYENNSTQIYFTNKHLINNHYSIWISNNTTNSEIEIGFYIN